MYMPLSINSKFGLINRAFPVCLYVQTSSTTNVMPLHARTCLPQLTIYTENAKCEMA